MKKEIQLKRKFSVSKISSNFKLSLILFLNILLTLVSAQNNSIDSADQPQTVLLKAADGTFTQLVAAADDDGDGIDNILEVNGFTYDVINGLQEWTGDSTVKHYKTDALRWSTDGDPYSDYMEVTGINMPSAIAAPENHPLVAARPVIVIKMEDYDVIPIETITDTKGGEQSSAFTNETSTSNTVSAEVTVEASLNPFKLASASVTAGYSHTWSSTQSSTSTFGTNWSNTRSSSPNEAAELRLRIYMENLGGATALDVMPTVNLKLGKKTISTFVPEIKADRLAPPGLVNNRFPENGTIVVQRDQDNNKLIVSLDDLKAIQAGTPLSLEVIQVSAKVVRWNTVDEDWNSDIEWAGFEGDIDPVSIEVRAELGDGENYRYQVFAGTQYWDPEYTLKDIISLIFDVTKAGSQDFVAQREYPEKWYLSSPSSEIINAWTNAGQPQNMFDVPVTKNTTLVMMSPGSNPSSTVNLATYSGDNKKVIVSAVPNNFPILSVTAKVPVNGVTQTLSLTQGDNSFYTNEIELDAIPDGPGTVTVENARGDKSTSTILLPAIYANAKDVKEYSSFLPDPGAEYWIYQNGDEDKPMLLYCIFFDPETHEELVEPREYLSLERVSGTVYSDYVAYNDYYRSHFNKMRINPSTLKIAIEDKTFSDHEIILGTTIPDWIKNSAQIGRLQWAYPEADSGFAHIDLSGTPYHLDVASDFMTHSNATTIINRNRKKVDIKRSNLQSFDYYDFIGTTTDSLQLVYDFEAVPITNGLEDSGNAMRINSTETSGYISMGSSVDLKVSDKLTIEAWIYPNGPGSDIPWGGTIINKEGEYELARFSDGTIQWAIANSNPGWTWRSSHYFSPEKQWLHVALVYDNSNSKMHVYFMVHFFILIILPDLLVMFIPIGTIFKLVDVSHLTNNASRE